VIHWCFVLVNRKEPVEDEELTIFQIRLFPISMDHGMYPGNKRSNDDMSAGPNENKRNRNTSSSRTEYRFLIATSDANAIFGRSSYLFFSSYFNSVCFF
jgi:hypothetical protein